jgi:hypothetical protein
LPSKRSAASQASHARDVTGFRPLGMSIYAMSQPRTAPHPTEKFRTSASGRDAKGAI